MKFFCRFKTDELIQEYWHEVSSLPTHIAITTPLNWSGPRQGGITTVAAVEMGLNWKL
jgi:hypothetical protein